MNTAEIKHIHEKFAKRLDKMLDLVARGRGIEILIRISSQINKGLESVDESYEAKMSACLNIPNLHPPQALSDLFSDPEQREKLELARKIADKLAHGLYLEARRLIRRYKEKYGLKTELNTESLTGLRVRVTDDGFLSEGGRIVKSIEHTLMSSKENLITEEFDLFVRNNYDNAAKEIFDDAWCLITANRESLALKAERLFRNRGLSLGKRVYLDEKTCQLAGWIEPTKK